MATKAKNFIPEGYHTVTPYLIIRDAAKALEFYKKAFGAEETMRMEMPNGQIGHAEVRIGNSVIMLGDENLEMKARSPQTLEGSPVGLMLYVQDVDKAFKRATDAGATVSMPLMDAFWGDRYGKLRDPFGHEWAMATHQEDLTPEEIDKRQKEFFSKGGCG